MKRFTLKEIKDAANTVGTLDGYVSISKLCEALDPKYVKERVAAFKKKLALIAKEMEEQEKLNISGGELQQKKV